MTKYYVILVISFFNLNVYGQWTNSEEGVTYNLNDVGVGTETPSSTISGTILEVSTTGDNFPIFKIERENATGKVNTSYEMYIGSGGHLVLKNKDGGSPIVCEDDFPYGVKGLWIKNNGNILIGKTTQQNEIYKLDIVGSVRANEMTINSDGADFVFEDDYELMSLKEVEDFINKNKHLPEIEPASLMQSEGINIGKINTQLLQKIEELTLYIIEQNKRIEKLENKFKVK